MIEVFHLAAISLLLSNSAAFATGTAADTFGAAKKTCKVRDVDFYWTSPFEGGVGMTPYRRNKATAAQLECMKRWAKKHGTTIVVGQLDPVKK